MNAFGAASTLLTRVVSGASRRTARNMPFRPHKLRLTQPVVSFSFDDFPVSAALNGAPILEDAGMLGTYFYSSGLAGRIEDGKQIATIETVADLAARGHEIGAHTHNHINVQTTSGKMLARNVEDNIAALMAIGLERPASFAYPFGVVSIVSKLALMPWFAGLRGITAGVNKGVIDLAHLHAQHLYDSTCASGEVDARLDEVERANGWLIFYTHEVCASPTEIGCTPASLAQIVAKVRKRGFRVQTVAAMLGEIGAVERLVHPAPGCQLTHI